MLTRTMRALEDFKAAHPDFSGDIDNILSLMTISGERVSTVTVESEAD